MNDHDVHDNIDDNTWSLHMDEKINIERKFDKETMSQEVPASKT